MENKVRGAGPKADLGDLAGLILLQMFSLPKAHWTLT
jgi:hypothetical protein